MWSPCLGAHRCSDRQDTTARETGRPESGPATAGRVTPYLSQCPPTVGVSERGVMGAPRSRPRPVAAVVMWQTPRTSDRDSQGGEPHHRMLRLIHTADVHLGARHDDLGEQARRPARAPVRGLQGRRRSRARREGRPLPDRRRPVRLERPAAPVRRAGRRRAQAPGRAPDPDGHHPGHPRRLRPGVDLPRLRPARRWPATARRRPRHRPRPGPAVGPPGDLRRRRPRPVFATKRAPHSPLRDLDATPGRDGRDVADRDGPRRDRDPRQDRPRRGRHHDRGDRRDATSTTWRSATGTRPRPGRPAPSPTPTRARPSRSRSTRTAPARSCSWSSTSAPARRTVTVEERQVGRTRFEKREIDAATVASQPALVEAPRRARPIRTSSSTSASSASGPTSSTSTSTRSRARSRRRSSRSASATRLAARPDRGPAAVAGHDRRRVHPRPRGADRRARGGRADGRGGRAARRAPPRPAPARRSRGLAVRIRRLSARDFRRYRELDIAFAPGLTVVRGPNEAGKTHGPARARAGAHPAGHEHRRRDRGAPPVGRAAGGPLGHLDRVRAGRGGRAEDRDAREDVRRRRRAPSASTTTARRSPTRRSPTRSWPS